MSNESSEVLSLEMLFRASETATDSPEVGWGCGAHAWIDTIINISQAVVSQQQSLSGTLPKPTIKASIIRIEFWGPLHYTYNKKPPK